MNRRTQSDDGGGSRRLGADLAGLLHGAGAEHPVKVLFRAPAQINGVLPAESAPGMRR